MNYLQQLEQALAFYDRNLAGPADRQTDAGRMFGGTGMSAGGERRRGLQWAQDAVGRQMASGNRGQDAFGSDAFGSDEAPNALRDFVRPSMAGAGVMPERAPRMDIPPRQVMRDTPMVGRAHNALARLMLMGGR